MRIRDAGAVVACVLILLGCPSGELGERPVVTFGTPETTGTSQEITVHLTVSDADLSHTDIVFEFSADGGAWTPMTISSATVGAVAGSSIRSLAATVDGVDCDVVWDSWADGVAAAGDASISIRATPRDIDGVGEPVALSSPITVNNHLAELVVSHTSVDFGARLARVPETGAQDVDLVITNGNGATSTVLCWEVTSDQPWLVVGTTSGTAPAVAPYQSSVALTADIDGAGLTASSIPYEATLTVTGWDTVAGGTMAHGSPVEIPVTVTVRDPEAEIFLHTGDGSTEVTALPEFTMLIGESNPAPQSFWVMNAGDEGSTLVWSAADNLTTPDWLVGFETTPTGATDAGDSAEVTVSVDGSGLSLGHHTGTITVSGTEQTSGASAAGGSRTVDVSLWVQTPPTISASPETLTFQAVVDGANPATQTLYISNAGDAPLDWSLSEAAGWLSLTPGSGQCTTGTDLVTVSVDITGLSLGTYNETITIDGVGATNSPRTALVTLAVMPVAPGPYISLAPEALTFSGPAGGPDPASQTFTISNPGTGTLSWGVTSDRLWLQAAPIVGTTTSETDTVTVTVQTTQIEEWLGPINQADAPVVGEQSVAVWTGSEMIVWGGQYRYWMDYGLDACTNQGGRYDPPTDTWTPTSTTGAPGKRKNHAAVWTGTEMIVHGGYNGSYLNEIWRYNPASNSWSQSSSTGSPTLGGHRAVWTGSEMIVWGGHDGVSRQDVGWRYNPTTGTWAPLAQSGDIPTARSGHAMAWTGTGLVIWGGSDGDHTNTGGRYDYATGVWTATTTTGAPAAKAGATAVWTGSEVIVWGGRSGWNGQYATNAGGRYDPVADSWQDTTLTGAPGVRGDHVAVWTGTDMIIFAGYNGVSQFLRNGDRYVPPVTLSGGTYTGTLTVSDPGASNTPQTVGVTFTVTP